MSRNNTLPESILAAEINSTPVLIPGLLHLIFYPFILVTAYVNCKTSYRKTLRLPVDYIIPIFTVYACMFEFANFAYIFGGQFARSSMVVGNTAYETTQLGYLNSPGSSLCVAQGFVMNVGGLGMIGMAFLLSRNTYAVVVTNSVSSGNRRTLTIMSQRSLKHNILIASVVLVSVVMPLIAAIETKFGPLALYCWIRCDEEGIDSKFTNTGKCWWRIVSLYGWFGVYGLPAVFYSVQVLRKLHQHQKSLGKSAQAMATRDAQKKLGGFTMVFCFICTLSSIVRLPSSLQPNPKTAANISFVEYGTLLIPIAGYFIFAHGKKVQQNLNCQWTRISPLSSRESRGSRTMSSEAEGPTYQTKKEQGPPIKSDSKYVLTEEGDTPLDSKGTSVRSS